MPQKGSQTSYENTPLQMFNRFQDPVDLASTTGPTPTARPSHPSAPRPGRLDLVVRKFSFPRQKAVPPGTVKDSL